MNPTLLVFTLFAFLAGLLIGALLGYIVTYIAIKKILEDSGVLEALRSEKT